MAEDIAHYKRAKYNGSPDHSFDWLWAASCRYLSMKREDYMQDSLNRSLKHSHAKALPGLDASKPKKGKGDNKGKDKPRSKTPARTKGGGTRPRGGSRERSQSREGMGKQVKKTLVMLSRKVHALGVRIADLPTLKNVGDPQAPSLHLRAPKARGIVFFTPLALAGSEKTAETGTAAVLVMPQRRE